MRTMYVKVCSYTALSEINFFLVSIRISSQAEMKTWGSCFSAVRIRSASKRYGYTAVVLRLRLVLDAPHQLACGSPSAVQRGWQAAWAKLARTARLGSPLLHHYRPGTSKRILSSLPAELAAPETHSKWLQLLYSLAADILHAHGATSTPPEARYNAVATPGIQTSAFASACAFRNAVLS
jgi:hypothetical protein